MFILKTRSLSKTILVVCLFLIAYLLIEKYYWAKEVDYYATLLGRSSAQNDYKKGGFDIIGISDKTVSYRNIYIICSPLDFFFSAFEREYNNEMMRISNISVGEL